MGSSADEDVDCNTWTSSDGAGRSTGTSDAKKLQAAIYAIADGDSARAATAITYFLNSKSNENIKREVLANISDKNERIYEQIVMGLQEAIAHHSSGLGGTRTKVSETFVKNVATAAIFHIVSEEIKMPMEAMMRILGTTKRQIKYAIAEIDLLISENCTVKALTRKTRCDKIVDKLEPYIFDFVTDNEFTRVDTNAKLREVVNPRDGKMVKEPIRLWRMLSKKSQYQAFFNSKHYRRFQSDHDNATVGFTTFRLVVTKVAATFVQNPTIKSCVDEVTTAVEYAMDAMKMALMSTQVKSLAESIVANDDADGMITYPELLQMMQGRSYKEVVERSCCAKEKLCDHHYDKSADVRTIVPRTCSHGEGACNKCGIEKRFRILFELKKMLTDEMMEAQFEVTIWHDARRAGTDKKGKHNAQKELTPVFKNFPDLIDYFLSTVQRCIPHHVNVIWQYIQTDVILSQLREDEAYVSTDFAATADLCAVEKLNSSTNAHCNICNMLVIYNKREVMVKTILKNGSEICEMITVYDVNVYHSLAETFEKGKKNDHVMHTATLNHVLERTSRKFIERDPTKPLKRVIIHTDNCPSQYRCRQTLMHTAVSDLQITHNFAVVGNFKGPHDAVRKDVKEVIMKRELEGNRSKDGLDAFRTCDHYFREVREQPQWKVHEAKNDPQLKAKGIYASDTRTFIYCVDSKATFEDLSLKYPGQIIFCNRENILDTHNQKPAFKGTVNMHQITNIKLEETAELRSQRKFPVYISDFFCECMKCRSDKEDECKHKMWKNKRKVVMMPSKRWIDPKMLTTTHQNDEALCRAAASTSDSNSNSIANQNCSE
jgi:hypothetical protein